CKTHIKYEEVDDTGSGDEEIADMAKADAEKTEEVKDDNEKAKLSPLSSSLSRVEYKKMIEESMQANVINEVKSLLPKFLPKAVSDFATLVIQRTINKALEKTPMTLAQSSSQAQSFLKAPEENSKKKNHDDDNKDEDPLAGPNQGTKTKRSITKESEPLKKSSTTKELSKGKSHAKTSKYGKSVTTEEPVEELFFVMASDDIKQTVDDVVNDDDQPPDDTTQTKEKAPKKDWFKQPPRPPTHNKHQVVVDQLEQPSFNNMVSAAKDPLTFDELMATLINFSKYTMNCCLTVPSKYFFNNELEYLKSSDPKKKYITSITKIKSVRYELADIEDMIPNLSSATKVGYDKDGERRIKH
nr:hypothetical protein [Tanacetum cinerariifolium]